jgi:hypothetical protein
VNGGLGLKALILHSQRQKGICKKKTTKEGRGGKKTKIKVGYQMTYSYLVGLLKPS